VNRTMLSPFQARRSKKLLHSGEQNFVHLVAVKMWEGNIFCFIDGKNGVNLEIARIGKFPFQHPAEADLLRFKAYLFLRLPNRRFKRGPVKGFPSPAGKADLARMAAA